MAEWTFDLATQQDLQPYYDPSILNDPGFDFSSGYAVPQMQDFGVSAPQNFGGMGVGPMPTFNPAQMGAPSQAGAPPMAPVSGSMLAPPPQVPPPGPAATQATTPLGGMPGAEDRASSAPKVGTVLGTGGAGPEAYKPGSAQQPDQNQGFDWRKMLGGIGGQVAGAGTQALIGGGLSLLGSSLAPKQRQPGVGGPAPAAAASPAPTPTTPTGTPNMGAPIPPTPGAQWSPLLMKQPGGSSAGSPAGLVDATKKRMKRGGQTGGMSLY